MVSQIKTPAKAAILATDYKSYCYEGYASNFDLLVTDGLEEQEAQKLAIAGIAIDAFKQFPGISPEKIWLSIHEAHVKRKTGKDISAELIAAVTSADQSWKKSSGHAFESAVKTLANDALKGSNIEIILQKDLSHLVKTNKISNEVRDISWLKENMDAANFDLFAVYHEGEETYVFGCVQSKTSIRDRVKGDREHSKIAMAAFFWSVAVVLDGDFLKLPKFRGMVNGGTPTYEKNGWHGLYSLSLATEADRLFKLDINFSKFAEHAKKACEVWQRQRQWFNSDWHPERIAAKAKN